MKLKDSNNFEEEEDNENLSERQEKLEDKNL